MVTAAGPVASRRRATDQTQTQAWGRVAPFFGPGSHPPPGLSRPRSRGGAASTVKPAGGIGEGGPAAPASGGGGLGGAGERAACCSKAVMQSARLSSGSRVSPAASRPVQRTSMYGGPLRIKKLEQLLHLVLGHAVRASRWWWWAGIRVAAEAVRSSEVRAQAFDVELGEDAPRRGYVEPVRVWRSAREDPEGAHPPRGERSRREGRVLRVQQHLVPHRELHVPPGGVELRLAPVLPLLLQRQHLRCHAPHESGGVLAWTCCVRSCGGGKRAAPRSA